MEQGYFTTEPAKAEMESILYMLVETDTSSLPGNERELAQRICKLLLQSGAKEEYLTRLPHEGNRASLRVILPGQDNRIQIGFAEHMDVVSAGSRLAWPHPPFGAHVKNGVLTARGAADMKDELLHASGAPRLPARRAASGGSSILFHRR